MTAEIVRVDGALPDGIERLSAQATADCVHNVALLIEEWQTGRERFGPPGALFAALAEGDVVGIGGVTPETTAPVPAMRMRRLFVAPSHRRAGLGNRLAAAMMASGLKAAPVLTANAKASPAAPAFWTALGFRPAPEGLSFTHWYRP